MNPINISIAKAGHSLIFVLLSILAIPLHAHHSFQAFDMQQTTTLEGVVTDFDLTNPHAYITLEVTNDQGGVDTWEVETSAANLLRRNGVDKNTFVAGERLSIEVNPPRNPSRRMANGEKFTKSDGTEIFANASPGQRTGSQPLANSIEGVWLGPPPLQGILIVDKGPVSNSWALTEKGWGFLRAYNGSQTDSVNCVPYSAPAVMLIPAPIAIDVGTEVVTIRIPNEEAIRHIYIDGRSHPETIEPSNQGHSIGYWDGDDLVIDTIRFSDHQVGNAFGVPSGSMKHLTERLSLNSDRSKLDYSFNLEDPEYLVGQIARSVQWTYTPDAALDIEPCDVETARRFLNAY